jgi:hypothetical protein
MVPYAVQELLAPIAVGFCRDPIKMRLDLFVGSSFLGLRAIQTVIIFTTKQFCPTSLSLFLFADSLVHQNVLRILTLSIRQTN